MPATEIKGLMTYVDEAGNHHALYPVTTADAVAGLEQLLTSRIETALGVIEHGAY